MRRFSRRRLGRVFSLLYSLDSLGNRQRRKHIPRIAYPETTKAGILIVRWDAPSPSNDVVSNCPHRRLRPIRDPNLSQDVLHMLFDRFVTYA